MMMTKSDIAEKLLDRALKMVSLCILMSCAWRWGKDGVSYRTIMGGLGAMCVLLLLIELAYLIGKRDGTYTK